VGTGDEQQPEEEKKGEEVDELPQIEETKDSEARNIRNK